MKQKGFLFDLNRCTGCGACMVACSIEAVNKKNHNEPSQIKSFAGVQGAVFQKSPLVAEGKQINWRQVYTFNETRHPEIPLFNLSMACNHCGLPACLKSCPAAAISKDPETGAVTVAPERCLGCKYCTWACPYDAPRYNPSKGVIEKCDFCIDRLKKGEAPACVCSCPTNALRLGDFDPDAEPQKIAGFTNAGLQPAIHIKELRPQQQVPECTASPPADTVEQLFASSQNIPQPKITLKSEWTLLSFTSIAFILVALLTAAVITPLTLSPFVFLGVGVVGMVLSTVHLGKKSRFLYAVRNFTKSWVSREIVLFSAFLGISFIYLQFLPNLSLVGWAAVFIGFLSLFAVDRIYQVAMQVTPLNFHSAHTLFNGLFLTGAFIGNIFIFSISGLIKLSLYLYRKLHFKQEERNIRFLISLIRLVFGFIIPLIIFILNPGFAKEISIIGIYGLLVMSVIIGELIDRSEYYDEMDIVTPPKQMLIDMEQLIRKRRKY
ncbi:MAG: dimethyl sulfoxide reductase anchor subunit [Candidatus Aminicenantes bacterium]|jgi:Fe-S-cluster-containing dehydrogenase component/DMSO reductase anchor subunit